MDLEIPGISPQEVSVDLGVGLEIQNTYAPKVSHTYRVSQKKLWSSFKGP